MNKTRIAGAIIFVLGITAKFALEDDYFFLSGIAIGVGVALLLTRKEKKSDELKPGPKRE